MGKASSHGAASRRWVAGPCHPDVYGAAQRSLRRVSAVVFTLRDIECGAARRGCT